VTTQHCPNCQALNAGEARECSLCGASLAHELAIPPEAEALPEVPSAAVSTPAPAGARYAAGSRGRRLALAGIGAAMGAITGPILFLVTHVALNVIGFLPLVGRLAALQPLGGVGIGLPAALAAALLGAVAGALTIFRESPWTGAVAFAALAMILRAASRAGADPGLDYGAIAVVYRGALVLVDGLFGGVYGYVVSLVVCGYMAAVWQRSRD